MTPIKQINLHFLQNLIVILAYLSGKMFIQVKVILQIHSFGRKNKEEVFVSENKLKETIRETTRRTL